MRDVAIVGTACNCFSKTKRNSPSSIGSAPMPMPRAYSIVSRCVTVDTTSGSCSFISWS